MLLGAYRLVRLGLPDTVMPAHRILVSRGDFSRFCAHTGLRGGIVFPRIGNAVRGRFSSSGSDTRPVIQILVGKLFLGGHLRQGFWQVSAWHSLCFEGMAVISMR